MPILIAAAAVFSVMNIATGTIAGKGTDTEKQAAGMVDPIYGSEARAFVMTDRKGKHGVQVHGSKITRGGIRIRISTNGAAILAGTGTQGTPRLMVTRRGPRSCEEVRDVDHKTRRSEEMKGKAFKDEGEEDYQDKMFNQLVFNEKGGSMCRRHVVRYLE
jgi:hypothetical protein